jgi:hypothetical protein
MGSRWSVPHRRRHLDEMFVQIGGNPMHHSRDALPAPGSAAAAAPRTRIWAKMIA